MSDKNVHYLNIENAIQRITNPSIFDRLLREIEASEIPTEYIERILVYYMDGHVVELSGNEITHPVPVNRKGSAAAMTEPYSQMREVKIYINTSVLETNINKMVEDLLGNRC